jgi:DNA-binding NarL/FixJ family response regulator
VATAAEKISRQIDSYFGLLAFGARDQGLGAASAPTPSQSAGQNMPLMFKPKAKAAQVAKTRVLIIDGHPIVRERLIHLIGNEADLAVCGEADDIPMAIDLIAATRPELVITGLSLRHSDGLGFIKDLHARYPNLKVLVFSIYDELLYGERVVRAGARGFIQKRETTKELLRSIRHVLSGQIYLSEKVAAATVRRFFGRSSIKPGSPLEQLSDRELEVLQLIGQGRSTRQIATALHIDVKTIETYRSRIKIKLKLNNSTELSQHAQHWFEHSRSSRV